MHVISEPHPFLRLAPKLAILALPVPFREQGTPAREMVQEVLDDEGALGYDDRLGGGGARGRDREDGRLPQSVDLLELGRCELGFLVPVEDLDLIGKLQLLKEPYYALGT